MSRVSMNRRSMGRGRRDVLTYCQSAGESSSQHGVPNETAMPPRVLMFQDEFLPPFVAHRPGKQKSAQRPRSALDGMALAFDGRGARRKNQRAKNWLIAIFVSDY
jgi:hypothetical protein